MPRRAAFDIGSGATKLMVADVSGTQVEKVHFSQEVPVSFAIDWKKSTDGNLSEDIMAQGMAVLQQFMEICTSLSVPATARCAVATEVFRKAGNGEKYLASVKEEFGLVVEMVSQEMEAEIGFRTAAALETEKVDDLICWDSGGASFQITSQNPGGGSLRSYVGAFGSGVTSAVLVEKIQGAAFAEKPTANPVSAAEADALISYLKEQLPPPAEWLSGKPVTAIGGPNSMFCVASEALGETVYALADLQRALQTVVGKTDAELATRPFCQGELREPAGLIVSKLCLLIAVMAHCSIAKVSFRLCTGSCPGLLISEERYAQA